MLVRAELEYTKLDCGHVALLVKGGAAAAGRQVGEDITHMGDAAFKASSGQRKQPGVEYCPVRYFLQYCLRGCLRMHGS